MGRCPVYVRCRGGAAADGVRMPIGGVSVARGGRHRSPGKWGARIDHRAPRVTVAGSWPCDLRAAERSVPPERHVARRHAPNPRADAMLEKGDMECRVEAECEGCEGDAAH